MTGDAGDVTTNVKGGYTGFRTIAVMSSESNRSSGAERQRAALRYRSRALRGQTRQPWTERAIRVVLAFGLPGTAWIVSNGNDHFRLPKELVFRGEAIVLLMLAVFWWTSRPRTWRLSFRPELALAFAVVAWGLVTTWSSTNRLLSEDSMITIAAGAVIFIVTCIALQTESMLLIDSLMLAACCNAILAIVQELKIWTPFRGAEVSTHMGTVGLLGNPNDVGTYLSGAALVAFAVAVNSRRTRRWVYASIALLLIVGIIASATKTAVIALAAALLVFGALHSRRAAIGVAALLAALAIAVAIPSTRLGYGVRTIVRALRLHDYPALSSERLVPFLTAVEMARTHPLTGVGPGCFKFHFMSYRLALEGKYPSSWTKGYPMNWGEVHNDHLQVAAESGAPGYLLFLAAIGLIAGLRRRSEPRTPQTMLARSMRWPFAVLIFVLCLAQFPLELAAARLMLLTIAAVCVTWDRHDDH